MIEIKKCGPEDAEAIARAVITAIHEDYDTNDVLRRIFTALTPRTDTQYSYLNALKAVDTVSGDIAGIIVAYDGGRLAAMREVFLLQFRKVVGHDLENVVDETDATEWYLDSLAVDPRYRRRGVARRLIEAAIEQCPTGLTPGLLCAPGNADARALYEKLGFVEIGQRPFMGEMMAHMTLPALK